VVLDDGSSPLSRTRAPEYHAMHVQAKGPDTVDLDVIEANRLLYARTAELYDRTEECVVDQRLRDRLGEILSRALSLLPPDPRVLDACGGSGNASLVLHGLGVQPKTVDISPEMLAIYERKAAAARVEADTQISEVDAFFERDPGGWDLIVFSSALHHIEDYGRTLELAAARLAPGGVIVTIFDPTALGCAWQRIRRFDYIAHVVLRNPAGLWPRLLQRFHPKSADADRVVGERAERHVRAGIDDTRLAERFEQLGLEVVMHGRFYEGRFAPTRFLHSALRTPSSFAFVVRRPPSACRAHASPTRRSSSREAAECGHSPCA